MKESKEQFAVINKDGTIEAIILMRGKEFYCYELHEDAPKNLVDVSYAVTDKAGQINGRR
jgi:hypothetical protein